MHPRTTFALAAALIAGMAVAAPVAAIDGNLLGSANAGLASESASGTDNNVASTGGNLPANLPSYPNSPSPEEVAPGPPPVATDATTPTPVPSASAVGTNAVATDATGTVNLGGDSVAGVGGASACGYASWFEAQLALEKDTSLAVTLDPDGNGIACESAMS